MAFFFVIKTVQEISVLAFSKATVLKTNEPVLITLVGVSCLLALDEVIM